MCRRGGCWDGRFGQGRRGGSDAAGGAEGQPPIGGMVRDPREIKVNPSLVRYLRERLSAAVIRRLVAIGVLRPRKANGELGPRSWKGLFAFLATIFVVVFVWTSIHIVQPGTVAVPVTLGHPGKPLDAGLHLTLPFTTAYSMSTRTQNYTMSSGREPRARRAPPTLRCRCWARRRRGHGQRDRALPPRPLESHRSCSAPRHQLFELDRAPGRPQLRARRLHVLRRRDRRDLGLERRRGQRRQVHEGQARRHGLLLQDFQLKQVTLDPNMRGPVTRRSPRSRPISSSCSMWPPPGSRPTSPASRRSRLPTRSRSWRAAASPRPS